LYPYEFVVRNRPVTERKKFHGSRWNA